MKFLSLLAILFLSCEKSVEPQPPSMTGRWVALSGSSSGNLDVIITQSDKSFSGSGTLSPNQCTITGINQHPSVSFNVSFSTTTLSASGSFVNDNSIRFTWSNDPTNTRFLNRQ